MLPAQKDVAIATLDHMAAADSVIEFGEDDAKQPLIEGFRKMLQEMPKLVEFKEKGAGDTVGDDTQDATVIAAKAVEYQQAQEKAGTIINIAQAVEHVTAGSK